MWEYLINFEGQDILVCTDQEITFVLTTLKRADIIESKIFHGFGLGS